MTHSEHEAKLLVRVARFQKTAGKLTSELHHAGLDKAAEAMSRAFGEAAVARRHLMTAIQKQAT